MKNVVFAVLCLLFASVAFSQGVKLPAAAPYYSEDVTFLNSTDGIILAGTLSLPQKKGNYPAVVLIAGNGKNNRDAEFKGHKLFLDITNYLVQQGIAVLRFDKRGVGQSGGEFKTATSADFADDAQAALSYLLTRKEINKSKIGLIGHSEGGLLAPMIAARSKSVAFIVLLAGPGLPGDALLLLQQEAIAKAKGTSEAEVKKSHDLNQQAFSIIKKYTNPAELKIKMTEYIEATSKNDPDKPDSMTQQEYVDAQLNRILSPWMVSFLRYNPAIALQKVTCPVLALYGSKDLQVLPQQNLTAVTSALTKGGNKHFTIKELPNLNHMFQECETGLPAEYEQIQQSISPIALKEVGNWITIQTK